MSRSPMIAFFCRCFGEIGRIVDLEAEAATLAEAFPQMTVEIRDCLCLEEDTKELQQSIHRTGAGKVLLAACSRLARGGLVMGALAEGDIHPADMELVDLREGCAWIHAEDPQGAAAKAGNLIRMGAAALAHRRLIKIPPPHPLPGVLIIGAGPAGLSAAASLARLDVEVHLVERTSKLGGLLNQVSQLYPEDRLPSEILSPLLKIVEDNPRVRLYKRSRVSGITPQNGSYRVQLEVTGETVALAVGAVVVACGAKPLIPKGYYRYDKAAGVITQMEMEQMFRRGPVAARHAVFIQCVGSRCAERTYCSTICCPSAIKNAMRLIREPSVESVTILYRDIMTPGREQEAYFRKARSAGISFVQYDPQSPPEILANGHVHGVRVLDPLSGETLELEADHVILSTPLLPQDENRRLAAMLGLRPDRHGFFSGAEPSHPLETPDRGVWICGSARWPVSAAQAVAQGEAAAVKVLAFINGNVVRPVSPAMPGFAAGMAEVNPHACSGCGNCGQACPFGAPLLESANGKAVFRIDTARCRGCGTCLAVCPNGAVTIAEQNSSMLREMIRWAF